MEDNKTLFQKISTELEAQLEQYKNQFPKNLAQIIRHNFGKILLVLVCSMIMMAIFSMSITCMLFYFAGTPGLLVFALIVISANKDEVTKDNGSLEQIEKLKSQLQPLAAYPDVKKYCDGFDEKVAEVTAQKQSAKANFKRYAITAGAVIVGIIAIEIVRIEINNQTGNTDNILKTSDDNYYDEVLDIDYSQPYFALQPLQEGGKALDFYIQKVFSYSLSVNGMQIANNDNDQHIYALIITDKDGKYVPRCPKFIFTKTDTYDAITSSSIYQEPLRILKFLRDHQQDLRYKIETLN
ncbi:MAG: hypothetical protein IIT37_06675 [Bacteroidales bacterium]|nr:hypothetical protein [Bacteroidales bacterium]